MVLVPEHRSLSCNRNRSEGEIRSSRYEISIRSQEIGAPMGCAPIAHALWGSVMNYNHENPKWVGNA